MILCFYNWILVADPRVRIVRVAVPTLIVIDGRGEKLEARTEKFEAPSAEPVQGGHLVSLNSILSEPPRKLGKSIFSVKGEVLVGVDGVSKDTVIRFDCADISIPMRQ